MLAGSKVDLLEDPKFLAQLQQNGEQPVSVAQVPCSFFWLMNRVFTP